MGIGDDTRKNLTKQIQEFVNVSDKEGIGTPKGGFEPRTVRFPDEQRAEKNAQQSVQTLPQDILWQLRYFIDQLEDSGTVIGSANFDLHPNDIFYSTITTTNGTLVYDVGIDGFNGHFVVEVAVNSDRIADFTITFGSSANLIFNGETIISTSESGSSIGSLQLLQDGPFDGYNRIEIYFYGHTKDSFLRFESNLNSVISNWRTPAQRLLEPPDNFTTTVDSDLRSLNDTNVNILTWDEPSSAENLAAYVIESRGPYNPYLTPPSGIALSGIAGQGTYVAGEIEIYSITDINEDGESLPSFASIEVPEIFPPLISGVYPVKNEDGGNLNGSGIFTYAISTIDISGRETFSNFEVIDIGISAIADAAKLVWTTIENPEIGLSGYRIYRGDDEGNFNTDSLLAIVPPSSGIYVDRGDIVPTTGSPLSIADETANKGLGIQLVWESAASRKSSNIYRGAIISGFEQNSVVISGIEENIFVDVSGVLELGTPPQFDFLAQVNRNTELFEDVGKKFNRRYDYRIASVNAEGTRSNFTLPVDVIAGVSDGLELPQPSGIYAEGFDRLAYVTFFPAVEFFYRTTRIYESSISSGLFSLVGTSDNGTFTRIGLNPSTTRFYQLAHTDITGREGPRSDSVSATTWAAQGSDITLSVSSDNPSGIFSSIPGENPIGLSGFKVQAAFASAISPYVDYDFKNKVSGVTVGNAHQALELGLPSLPLASEPDLVGYKTAADEASQSDYDILEEPKPNLVGIQRFPQFELWDSDFTPGSGISSQLFVFDAQDDNIGDLEFTLSISSNNTSFGPITNVINSQRNTIIGASGLRFPNTYGQSFKLVTATDIDVSIEPRLSLERDGIPFNYEFQLKEDVAGIPGGSVLARALIEPGKVINGQLTPIPFSPHIVRTNRIYWITITPPAGTGDGLELKWNQNLNRYSNGQAFDSFQGANPDGFDFMFRIFAFDGSPVFLYNKDFAQWDQIPELSVFKSPGFSAVSRTHTIPASGTAKYVNTDNSINLLVVNEGKVSSNYVQVRNQGQFNIDIRAFDGADAEITLSKPIAVPDLPNTFIASGVIAPSTTEGIGTAQASGVTISGDVVSGETSFVLDTQPPSCTITIEDGAANTSSRAVRLSLSATDSQTGVDKFQLSDDAITWTDFFPNNTFFPYVLTDGVGDKVVYARFADKVGNLSPICSGTIELVTAGSTIDHGNLIGLSDDDHIQYLLADGSRDFGGSFKPDGNNNRDLGQPANAFRQIHVNQLLGSNNATIQIFPNSGTTDTTIEMRNDAINNGIDIHSLKPDGNMSIRTSGTITTEGSLVPFESGIDDLGSEGISGKTFAHAFIDDLRVSGVQVTGRNYVPRGSFSNLTIYPNTSSPGAEVDITADDIMMNNPSGITHRVQAFEQTINISGVGINGLDTGTIIANTWYYVWGISNNTDAGTAGLFSTSFVSPVLPNTYEFATLLGATRTDDNALLLLSYQVDKFWQPEDWGPFIFDGSATDWTDINLSDVVPLGNSEVMINSVVEHESTATIGGLYMRNNRALASSGILVNIVNSSMTSGIATTSIICDSDKIIEYQWAT